MNNLITAGQLHARLGQNNLVIIDASWHLPNQNRNARAEYAQNHIAGAVFYDLDRESRTDTFIPHQALPAHLFQHSMRKLGINNDSPVVVYDSVGCFSAGRLWYLLRAHGFYNVAVLDGGLPAWVSAGYAVETGEITPQYGQYINKITPHCIIDKNGVDNVGGLIIDARSADRFYSRVPEPRPSTRSGHIKGAVNIPYNMVLNPDGTFKNNTELQTIFDQFDTAQPITTYCGSGVTACVILLALAQLGLHGQLYDGSWAEYGFMG